MKNFIRKVRAANTFTRAGKLFAKRDYEGAIQALEAYDAPSFYQAKAVLFIAICLHRKGDLAESVAQYDAFLSSHLEDILDQDRAYLEAYARFFVTRARQKLGDDVSLHMSVDALQELAKSATLATRGEFTVRGLAA